MSNKNDKEQAVEVAAPAKDPVKKERKKGGMDDEGAKKELSDEDLRIKGEVGLLAERLQDSNRELAATALRHLTEMLRVTTGTVGAIPKPLKFIRPMFPVLEAAYSKMTDAENRKALADVLSLIAMTLDLPETLRCLHYKLQGHEATTWSHEYLRHLAGEVGTAWHNAMEKNETTAHLDSLVRLILLYMIQHQDEPAACDLVMEIDQPERLVELTEDSNFRRVCFYLISVSKYLPSNSVASLICVVFDIFMKHHAYTSSLRMALILHDSKKIDAVFAACGDVRMKKQLALICGRFRAFIDVGDDELNEIIGNTRLSEWFLYVAQDMDSIAPKIPEDIYKTHLMDQRTLPSTANSHIHNLASTFVNAFANTAFTKDKLLTTEGTNWIYQTKDHRMMSASASLGLIHLWDHESGLAAVDKYSYSEDPNIKAGSLLATGILMCGVRSPFDPAMPLLQDYVTNDNREVRIGAILGLGYAYCGTSREDVMSILVPLIADGSQPVEIQCFAAFSLALVFAGTCNADVSEALVTCLMEKDDTQLLEPCVRYLVLALGALFLGRQDKADTLLDASKALSPVIARYAEVVFLSCAYAATGNVVTIQKLFSVVAEAPEEPAESPTVAKPAAAPAAGATAATLEGSTAPTAAPAAPAGAAPAAASGGAAPVVAPTATPPAGTAPAPAAAAAPKDATEPAKNKALNHKAAAVLGVGLVTMGEGIGVEMCQRAALHVLMQRDKDPEMSGRRAVPLCLALLAVSSADMSVVETLSKLSHDADGPTAMSAILGLGVVGAGTNNARIAQLLRNLAGYYFKEKDSNFLYLVRLAQGMTCLGKGHLTCDPLQSEKLLVSPTAVVGLLGLLTSALDCPRTLLDRYHYMAYAIVPAINTRMLLTVDGDLKPIQTQVRVGQPVDTVAVPGKPKRITGFQTHNTPVLLQASDRAELAVQKYRSMTAIMEGVIVLEEKPEITEETLETD